MQLTLCFDDVVPNDATQTPPTPRSAPELAIVSINPVKVERSVRGRGRSGRFSQPAEADVEPKAKLDPLSSTLSDVMAALETTSGQAKKYTQHRTALRKASQVIGRPLSEIPATPAVLGSLLDAAAPAAAGINPIRWHRIRSLTRGALVAAGIELLPARDAGGQSPTWKALAAALLETRLRNGLSRPMSYFSRRGIEPDDVGPEHLEEFRQAMCTASLVAHPESRWRGTMGLWNRAVVALPEWPQVRVELPPDPRRYSQPWESFVESYRNDVAAFISHSGNQNPLAKDYAPSIAPRTAQSRLKQLKTLSSALILSGCPAEELTSLAVMVEPKNAEAALGFLLTRNGGLSSPHLKSQADLLVTIAKYWVKAAPEDIAVLATFAASLKIKSTGMVDKNRERLRQFNLPANKDALLHLPARVFAEAAKAKKGDKSEAVQVMLALAVELLIQSTLRLENLVGIEIGRHLVEVRRGRHRIYNLVIPKTETKTGVPFAMEVPPDAVKLLDIYLEHYRHRIYAGPSVFLFPGRGGKRRADDNFSANISRFIFKRIGLRVNVHLFRHIGVKLYLEAHPGDIQTMSTTLTHSSTKTTQRAYAENDTEGALRRYDQNIAALRERSAAPSFAPSLTTKRGGSR
jgi:integrase